MSRCNECFGVIVLFCWLTLLSNSIAQTQVRGAWQIEIVDGTHGRDSGSFSSLVIDHSGSFHLVYSNSSGTALHYAFRAKADKRWDKTTIDAMGGNFESLAVDSRGWAHIAYNSPKLDGLHYAHWDGKVWQTLLIDAVKTNRQTSIQLDSQDHPRISYYRESYADRRQARCLKFAYFDGTTWFTQTVDHRPGTGSWNSLALDRDEHPEISYSIATGFLGFASLDQSEWQHGLADFQNGKDQNDKDKKSKDYKDKEIDKRHVDTDSSLVIGADGQPSIAYINATERTINYAWRTGTVWHQETVDSVASTGADSDRVSLKLDKGGRPHLVFYDSGLGTLKYATRDNDKKEWHTEIIDDGNTGQYASLALDENNQPMSPTIGLAINNSALRIVNFRIRPRENRHDREMFWELRAGVESCTLNIIFVCVLVAW